jgi:hypothetical protein
MGTNRRRDYDREEGGVKREVGSAVAQFQNLDCLLLSGLCGLSLRTLAVKGFKPQSAPRTSLRTQRKPLDKRELHYDRWNNNVVLKFEAKFIRA